MRTLQSLKQWFLNLRDSKYFLVSLLAHGFLLVLFLSSVETGSQGNAGPALSRAGEIVQAVVMDEAKVEAEVSRLRERDVQVKAEKLELAEKQKQLSQSLEKIKKERAQEQTKLDQLKQDMAKAKHEEQTRISEIKIAKEKEKKQLAALDDQRQAEQDRMKQLRREREKEEHKRAEAGKQATEAQRKASDAKRIAREQAGVAAAAAASAARQGFFESEAQNVANEWGERVKLNKHEVFGIPPGLKTELGIKVLADGSIQARVLKSSGNALQDESAMKAVYKTQPFPLPSDPDVREKLKEFVFTSTSGEGGQ